MVFGKNIENPEKYSNYVILKGEKAIEYYNSPEKYHDFIVIDNDAPIILFDKKRVSINLNKPIIVGFCILDISKHIMAEHYYRLKDIFKDKMKLLYTDTDSFVLYINMNEKEALSLLKQDKYEQYFEFPDSKVKKIPGRMALEKICKYFKAFASKHYIMDKEEKCKGVPKHCTTIEEKPIRKYTHLRSKNHVIVLENVEKKLKYSDEKKVYLSNDEVVPFGYKGLY
jgi:hypothetical protein